MNRAGEILEAAPGAEWLSVAFANTLFAVRGHVQEGLESPERLAAWLSGHPAVLGVVAGPRGSATASETAMVLAPAVSEGDLALFLDLRDAIRTLIRAEADAAGADAEALAVLNRSAALAPAWPELVRDPVGYRVGLRGSGRPVEAALGRLARDAMGLLAGGDVALLRACQGPGCVQFFVKDRSRRHWCSPGCGNRARVAKHYARSREAKDKS
jgi:predicted RNA-binding Zn ribbon-like protein